MIRCHLSRLMGEKKVKTIEVARETGVSRNMISALYYENAKRIDLSTLAALCKYFNCQPGDLLEYDSDEKRHEQKSLNDAS